VSAAAVIDLFRSIIGLALEVVPHDELAKVLTEEAVKRQNLAADAAEVAKGLK
jgi:hypothetical protein